MNRVATVGRRVVGVVALALAVAACGGSAPGSPAGASSAPSTVERTLTARDIAFEPAELRVPTGSTVVIAFDNTDPGVPHGLVLYADAAGTIKLAEGSIVTGPDHQRFEIPSLLVGRYRFSCIVHPNMNATLVVDPR